MLHSVLLLHALQQSAGVLALPPTFSITTVPADAAEAHCPFLHMRTARTCIPKVACISLTLCTFGLGILTDSRTILTIDIEWSRVAVSLGAALAGLDAHAWAALRKVALSLPRRTLQ